MLFSQNVGDETCSHGELWVWKEGVARATGKPYAFWAASHKTADGSYCKDKPSQKFIASQAPAPAKPKLVPEDDLGELPF